MAKVIVERIGRIKHTCYCEPFVGMGGMFFRRKRIPDSEVINDRACPARRRSIQPTVFRRFIRAVYDRLGTVTIENLSYEACIARYDRPFTLFYLDPPYYGREQLCGKGLFERDDFEHLAAILSKLKGRFILSLNDLPEVREIFKDFTIGKVSNLYRMPQPKTVTELLISN